jgi:hypothetical protein
MKASALLFGAALSLGFVSYAQEPMKDGKKASSKVAGDKAEPAKGKGATKKSSGTCEDRICPVAVTANSCETIDVRPGELTLKGQEGYEIVWTIPAGTDATFRDQGIVGKKSKKNSPLKDLGLGEQGMVSDKEVRLLISPRAKGRWYYSVLIAYAGKKCTDYDPVIINEMK